MISKMVPNMTAMSRPKLPTTRVFLSSLLELKMSLGALRDLFTPNFGPRIEPVLIGYCDKYTKIDSFPATPFSSKKSVYCLWRRKKKRRRRKRRRRKRRRKRRRRQRENE